MALEPQLKQKSLDVEKLMDKLQTDQDEADKVGIQMCMKQPLRSAISTPMFFWDYSGVGIPGTDGICVLLGALPFSERTECHSVHFAPDSRMKGIRSTRNFWREILRGRPRRSRVASGIPFSEEAFFSKLKFRVFCYSFTGIRIARIVPKESTLSLKNHLETGFEICACMKCCTLNFTNQNFIILHLPANAICNFHYLLLFYELCVLSVEK